MAGEELSGDHTRAVHAAEIAVGQVRRDDPVTLLRARRASAGLGNAALQAQVLELCGPDV